VVEVPLFSCYLFLWGLPDHAYAAVSAKRVAQIIQVPDQVAFARELAQVRAAIDAGAELGPYRFLTKGRRARVTAGPFEGIEGLIEDHVRPERLILRIYALGRAVSLEVDVSLLELVD
jgi:transcription antitermination factor NusG